MIIRDDATAIALGGLAFFLGCIAIFVVGFAAVPIILVIGAAAGIHWYMKSGPATESLTAAATTTERKVGFPPIEDFSAAHLRRFVESRPDDLPANSIYHHMISAVVDLYSAEDLANPLPPLPPKGTIEEGRYRDRLLDRLKKNENPERTLEVFHTTLASIWTDFTDRLPAMARIPVSQLPDETPPPTSVPLIDLIDPRPIVQRIYDHICAEDVQQLRLFASTRKQLLDNALDANKGKAMLPQDSDLGPSDFVRAYLKQTPFEPLFDAQIAFQVPERARMEHTVIVAGSGWGKTQLLQSLIANDLQTDDPPSLIVLDSTGAMIQRIQKLALFNGKLRDRILIIDPAHSPSLNMFDVSTPRFDAYSAEQKEDVQTEVIGLFNYIFASESYDLTAHMGLAFSYAIRLMLSRKGSTITDLRQLLEEPAPKAAGYTHSAFKDDIDRLDKDTQDFFAQHFFSAALVGARGAIARRLHSLVAVPAFRRMFTASANTLDLFAEMQKGTIILVNTNQQLLKDDAMVLFGRFVIAKALSAALERATVPVERRRPTFLIIDEAAPYFDQTFESLLTRVRQFKLGVVIAFQHLEQASEKLRSAIASSTSIKYAGGLGFSDRRWLAREMETTPEFIGAQRKDGAEPPKWSQFAIYVRNYTQKALSLTIPFYALENMPEMDEAAHLALLEANRRRVTAIAAPEPKKIPDEPPLPQSVAPQEPAPAQEPAPPQADHGEPGRY